MTPAELRKAVYDDLGKFSHDPLGFVLYAYPWGKPGALEKFDGPDEWQRDVLQYIASELKAGRTKIRVAVASGKGIGKSALISWLIHWGEMTFEGAKGVVTANTDTQLKTKTWAELHKWQAMLFDPLKAEFALEATSLHSTEREAERRWRIDAIPNSEKNSEAFAGLHNQGSRVLALFDEGSAIPDAVYDTTDGMFSDADTEAIEVVFGNPTRSTGRFREFIEGRLRGRWKSWKIDSRKVAITDKAELQSLVDAYGEDSDYVRVNIKGDFPRATSAQFIPNDVVDAAIAREPGYISSDPLIFGVDVARFGDDDSVLAIRRGRDAVTFPWTIAHGWDTMRLASHVAEQALLYKPDAIFVDVGNFGAGVVDRLNQLNLGVMVIGVDFGGPRQKILLTSGESVKVHNNTAAMYARLRDWLKFGSILNDETLKTDLTVREYGYDSDMNIQLERKEDLKKRLFASPDRGDALALTFAYPVQPRPVPGYDRSGRPRDGGAYDIHADLR